MKDKNENIIMFPKWQNDLEKEAKQALEDKAFTRAYKALQQLYNNGNNSYEVMTGLLICMMELDLQLEAEALCESLIETKDSHTAGYIHIYATLLFQSSQYPEVIEFIEDSLSVNNLDADTLKQLEEIYQLSRELQNQKDQEILKEYEGKLHTALLSQNSKEQWSIIMSMNELSWKKDIPILREMLEMPSIHPVIKSAILDYYITIEFNEKLTVTKFDRAITFTPSSHNKLITEEFYKDILDYLEDMETNEPSSFQLIDSILHMYAYVFVPFLPSEEEYPYVAEAIRRYIRSSFDLKVEETQIDKVTEIITEQIEYAQTVYRLIVEN
ncbi:DUF3196 family protein [Saliterribacillus persicus]|uniref:Tetratricopeptide repeat protein n=1 Tax=Saliterribacillus persicus TaxID=930114 RepID=A0A368XH70_9BACI|nr:DUF3196 family protein [Saliterribacillus persicus]RCW66368.1 hypothetical protein DFR57_10987 [Saliterribacillus persicus]